MTSIVESLNSIMSLQIYLQVAIPTGYLGYLLARLGIRHHDKVTDIIFTSLIFAFLSLFIWHLADTTTPVTIQILLSVLMPLIVALLWRKCLHSCILDIFYKLRIANLNHFPDVWTEIIENTNVGLVQVIVNLKNGTSLKCDYIYKFQDAPLDLMRWDKNENIALYVTHIKSKNGRKFTAVTDKATIATQGVKYYRLTYIPKENIETIDLLVNKPTG